MCGIAGIATDAHQAAAPGVVRAMLGALDRRGPDANGTVALDGAVLGSTRLAVIDEGGSHQPMRSADGRYTLVFNGEILNYRELQAEPAVRDWAFRTNGDTEVLLAMLVRCGPAALPRLNGQFAGALWDGDTRTLLLFRDRFGICPLHYARTETDFAFASTLTALLRVPGVDAALDPSTLAQIMCFWTPRAPRTAALGIQQLPPASYAVVGGGHMSVGRYWTPTFITADPKTSAAERAEELRAVLVRAVDRALRADTEVATLISGGIDSAVIAMLASAGTPGRASYSITFDDPVHDESPFQRIVAAAAQTRHYSLRCGPEEIATALPAVVAHAETPFLRFGACTTSMLARRIREDGVKAVLTGEGADELFAGYTLFKELAARTGDGSINALGLAAVGAASRGEDQAPQIAALLAQTAESDPRFPAHILRWRAGAQLRGYLTPGLIDGAADPLDDLFADLNELGHADTPLARAQQVEILTLLPGYLLATQGDRAFLSQSVEARFPFLDNEVVDVALRLDDGDKLKGGTEKYILRRAMDGVVPPAILQRAKHAYRAPVAEVLRSSVGQRLVADVLDSSNVAAAGIFVPRKVAWLVDRLRTGRPLSNTQDMVLAVLITTHLWLDTVAMNRRITHKESA